MDLSHWNLLGVFSLMEAARLADGVDIAGQWPSAERLAKSDFIYDRMSEAYLAAENDALFHLTFVDRDPNITEAMVFGPNSLPSNELTEAVARCVRTGRDLNLLLVKKETGTFSRKELDRWFRTQRFTPCYSFVLPPMVAEPLHKAAREELESDRECDELISGSDETNSATSAQDDESPAERRAKHDLASERGCRELILRNWDKVEKLYGGNASARQVLRILSACMGAFEQAPDQKTVSNRLSELRREKLIP